MVCIYTKPYMNAWEVVKYKDYACPVINGEYVMVLFLAVGCIANKELR